MRRRAPTLLLLLAIVSCGDGPEVAVDHPEPTSAFAEVVTGTTPPPPPPVPTWAGYAATRAGETSLVAYAHGPIDVFDRPGAAEAVTTIDRTTILGTVTVLGVIGEPADGWVEVMLPIRPNGSTGWVRIEEVSLYVADGRIVVDLEGRRLRYIVDGVEVLTTEVGVGSSYNETPVGTFYVTDNVTLANPSSAWGPHALGISAHSDTITGFNGGDGIIGIHGTNNPGSVGDDISLGCIRLPNEMITLLHEMVPIGTRVEINA